MRTGSLKRYIKAAICVALTAAMLMQSGCAMLADYFEDVAEIVRETLFTGDRDDAAEAGREGSGEEAAAEGTTGAAEAEPEIEPKLSPEASAYAKTVEELNTGAAGNGFDPDAAAVTPAPRDIWAQWDKSLFNRLKTVNTTSYSAAAYSYEKTRMQYTNSQTGNLTELEIYTDRSSGRINMIVSIEYVGDRLKITDYYFEDNGRINFIFVRFDTVYTPEYAMLSRSGERFYFANDQMVKWRIIEPGGSREFPVGQNELARGGRAVSQCILYSDLTPQLQSEYDAAERRMLTEAYGIMNFVRTGRSVSVITGFVTDSGGGPAPDADVKLYCRRLNSCVYACRTKPDGSYSICVPSDSEVFFIRVSRAGCTEVTVYDISISPQITYSYVETVLLAKAESPACRVVVLAVDAFNTTSVSYGDGYAEGLMRLGGASVSVRGGINNRSGEVIFAGVTDGEGYLELLLAPGCYTVELSRADYETAYITIIVRTAGEVIQLTANPVLGVGEVRIVLTWGSRPSDLDSHLFTPLDDSSDDLTYHIWYSNMSDGSGNDLDVDDTTSFGPETMTIKRLGSGLYKYFVADFTNCSANYPTSMDMSNSGARVNVYTDRGLAASFAVPVGRQGVIWEVFEIRDMQIIPIQRYYSNIADKPWWHQDKWW